MFQDQGTAGLCMADWKLNGAKPSLMLCHIKMSAVKKGSILYMSSIKLFNMYICRLIQCCDCLGKDYSLCLASTDTSAKAGLPWNIVQTFMIKMFTWQRNIFTSQDGLAEVHVAMRIHFSDTGNPLAFHPMPSSGQNFNVINTSSLHLSDFSIQSAFQLHVHCEEWC